MLFFIALVLALLIAYLLIKRIEHDLDNASNEGQIVYERMEREAEQQMEHESMKGKSRTWSYSDTTKIDLYEQGDLKELKITCLKVSEEDKYIRLCQCNYIWSNNWVNKKAFTFSKGESTNSEFRFDQLISSEISINEEQTQFEEGSIQGRSKEALLGTLLFGIAGGVIAASGERGKTSKIKTTKKITSFALEVATTQKSLPYIYIYFYKPRQIIFSKLDEPLGIDMDEVRELPEFKKLRRWYSELYAITAQQSR